MKKAVVLVLLTALLAASGCAGSEAVPEKPVQTGAASFSARERTYSALMLKESQFSGIDLGEEGFECTVLAHILSWQGDGYSVSVSVAKADDFDEKGQREKTVKYGNREFLLNTYGTEESDKVLGYKEISWQNKGYIYWVSQHFYKDVRNIACPETALLIEQGDYTIMQGLKLEKEMWITTFESEEMHVNIFLDSGPYGDWRLKNYQSDSGYMIVREEDGFEYYNVAEGRRSTFPYYPDMAWDTTIGAIDIFCSIDEEKNDHSADVRGFINPSLARSITEQLGAKILPLPKA